MLTMKIIIRIVWVVWAGIVRTGMICRIRRRSVHQILKSKEELLFINETIIINVKGFHGLFGLRRSNDMMNSQFHKQFIKEISHFQLVEFSNFMFIIFDKNIIDIVSQDLVLKSTFFHSSKLFKYFFKKQCTFEEIIVIVYQIKMKGKIQQLKNQVSNHPLYALIGGVLCAGAGYAFYKYAFNSKNSKTPKAPLQQQKSFQQIYNEVIMSVQQSISKYQALNGQVIKCILRNQYKLAEPEYKAFILKVRNQRRKVMKNKSQYTRLILSMDTQNEELMDKNLNAILAHFNIQKTQWIETVELWSSDTEQNKEEWENLLIQLENQLLDSLRNKQKSGLSYKKLEEIIKFKIYTLDHLNESGIDFESSMSTTDESELTTKYIIIEKYIQDLVFNRFGVEQEDLLYSENQLSEQDKDKIYTFEDQFTEKIRTAIYGDENSEVEENVEGHDQRNQQSDEDEQDLDGGDFNQDSDTEHNKALINEESGQKQNPQKEDEQEDEGQYF